MAWPVAGFTSAMHPQVSSGEGCERGYHVSSETILSACANAGVRRLLVARLPVVDVVVGLPLLLVADQGRAVRLRLVRRDDDPEWLVVDVDQLERVLGDVGVGRDHRRDLLALEPHLVGDEHRLRVPRKRRHPRQVVLCHQLAGDDRDHALERLRRRGVDPVQLRVGVRAAQDRHVQHPGQMDVVDVVAGAADEAVVLHAPDAVTDPSDLLDLGCHVRNPPSSPRTRPRLRRSRPGRARPPGSP